jgi:hypothetical protein
MSFDVVDASGVLLYSGADPTWQHRAACHLDWTVVPRADSPPNVDFAAGKIDDPQQALVLVLDAADLLLDAAARHPAALDPRLVAAYERARNAVLEVSP